MSEVYEINKGVNKPLEFRGLKAQYIMYLGAGLVGLLILFAVGYIAGVPVYLCVVIIAILGYLLFTFAFRYSKTYGEHGLMKEASYRRVPSAVTCYSRTLFTGLAATRKDKGKTGHKV